METVSINTTIDNVIRENKIYRFSSELQYNEDEDRKKSLRDILKQLQNDNNDKSSKARENLNVICEKLNQNQLKKKWYRLTKDQKIDQITKYYEEKIENEITRKNTISNVLEMLESEKLKNKNVEYNEKDGKIINIEIEIKNVKEKISKKPIKKSQESGSNSLIDSD